MEDKHKKILTPEKKEEILSYGVRDMPSNPASNGYSQAQIREFYYRPEEKIIDAVSTIEDVVIRNENKIEETKQVLNGDGENQGLVKDVEDLKNKTANNESDIEGLKTSLEEAENLREEITAKTNVIKTDGNGNKFLNDAGTYTEACDCDGKQVLVDDALSNTSENPVQNKVIKAKFDAVEKNINDTVYNLQAHINEAEQAIDYLATGKQDKLTAGANITIEGNVISAQGGSGGSGIRTLETAPTTLTEGYVGEIVQVKDGTACQCTSIADGVYTWVKLINVTNLATQNEAGVVKMSGLFYLDANGKLNLNQTSTSWLNTDRYTPAEYKENYPNYFHYLLHTGNNNVILSLACLPELVKVGLCYPKANKTTAYQTNWTDEEKAKARATLGITGGGSGVTIYSHTYTFEDESGLPYTVKFKALTNQSLIDLTSNEVFLGMQDYMQSIITYPVMDIEGNWTSFQIDGGGVLGTYYTTVSNTINTETLEIDIKPI